MSLKNKIIYLASAQFAFTSSFSAVSLCKETSRRWRKETCWRWRSPPPMICPTILCPQDDCQAARFNTGAARAVLTAKVKPSVCTEISCPRNGIATLASGASAVSSTTPRRFCASTRTYLFLLFFSAAFVHSSMNERSKALALSHHNPLPRPHPSCVRHLKPSCILHHWRLCVWVHCMHNVRWRGRSQNNHMTNTADKDKYVNLRVRCIKCLNDIDFLWPGIETKQKCPDLSN